MTTLHFLIALGTCRLTPLMVGIRVNNNYKFSSYLTENILSLSYGDQSVNVVQAYSLF
jgi:hypothetical protein